MRAFVLGAAALLASTSLAFADDIMAGLYGNTIIAKSAMSEIRMHYKADHTFDGTGSSMMGSMALKGTWALDDKGQLCRTYETPPPGVTNPLCTPWSAHKVGETWTMNDRTITLVQGIQ
jgi:hypothetical protein